MRGQYSSIYTEANNEAGFCLKLGNDQGWNIISTQGLSQWVKKLASIMELKVSESNGYPKLIFTQIEIFKGICREPKSKLVRNIKEALSKPGWKVQNGLGFRLWLHRDIPDAICEIKHEESQKLSTPTMRLSLYPVYKRAQESGGLPFHAALVERNGIGVLLAAQSNIGKSTCCRRLPPPWQALCDNEALIVQDNQKQYRVHSFPTWGDYLFQSSGRTWNVQSHIPLSAIFFLEQAETDEVLPLGQGQAAVFIMLSAMQVWRRAWIIVEQSKKATLSREVFENACKLAKTIPAFTLHVSFSGRFWEEMEKVL